MIRVHDFMGNANEMRNWLKQCRAESGSDEPEACAKEYTKQMFRWKTTVH